MSKRPWEALSPEWYDKEQQQQARQILIRNDHDAAAEIDRAQHGDKSKGGFSRMDDGELRNYPQTLGQNAPQEKSPLSSSKSIPEATLAKPKRALSAYNFFLREERQRILDSARQSIQHEETTTTGDEDHQYIDNKKRRKHEEEGSDTGHQQQQPSFQEIGKIIGMHWQEIKKDPTQMDKYAKLADKDRIRFDREMDVYNAKKKELLLKRRAFDRAQSAARRRPKGDDRVPKGSEKEDSIKPSHDWPKGTLAALSGAPGGEVRDTSVLSTTVRGAVENLPRLQGLQMAAGPQVPELGSYTAMSQSMGEMSFRPPVRLDEWPATLARPDYETGNLTMRGLREPAFVQDPLALELARRGLLVANVQAEAFSRSQPRYPRAYSHLLDSSSASSDSWRRLNMAANLLPPDHQALSSSVREHFVIPSSRPSLEHAVPSQYHHGVADEDVYTQNIVGGNRQPQPSSLSNPLVYSSILRGGIGELAAGGVSMPSPQDPAQLLPGYPRSGPPTRDYNQGVDDPSQHPQQLTDVRLGNEGSRSSQPEEQQANSDEGPLFQAYRR